MLPHPIMYLEWYFSLPIEFPTFSLTTNLNCVRSESLTWIVWNVAGAEEIVSFEKVWTRLEQKVLAAKGKSSVCMHVFLWTKYWAIPGLFFFIFGLFNTDSKQLIVNKICQWQDSNCRFLVSVETALPTEAQPRPLLLFIFVFSTDNRKFVHSKNLPMTGFKPHTFGMGSDRSINWATNQASFLFIFVFSAVYSKCVHNKICRWLDSNHWLLVFEATSLPTEPQPLTLPAFILYHIFRALILLGLIPLTFWRK